MALNPQETFSLLASYYCLDLQLHLDLPMRAIPTAMGGTRLSPDLSWASFYFWVELESASAHLRVCRPPTPRLQFWAVAIADFDGC
jgi:hypothetical protein